MRYFFLVGYLLFFSCGKLKKTASSESSDVKSEKEGAFSTESITIEKADTTISLAEVTENWSIPQWVFVDTIPLTIETPFQKFIFEWNGSGKNVNVTSTIKERKIPVVIDRIKLERADSTIKSQLKVNEKKTYKGKEKTDALIPWWVWLIAILIVALIALRPRILSIVRP